MDDSQFKEIIDRLDKIESALKKIQDQSSFGMATVANVLGDAIWSTIEYNAGLFKDPGDDAPDSFPFPRR